MLLAAGHGSPAAAPLACQHCSRACGTAAIANGLARYSFVWRISLCWTQALYFICQR
jgi:hypothetical protein